MLKIASRILVLKRCCYHHLCRRIILPVSLSFLMSLFLWKLLKLWHVPFLWTDSKKQGVKVSSKELHREHFDRAVFLPLSRWNESSVGGQACMELSEQKIRWMGVRAQCKCIIKLDAEAKLPRLVCVCVLFFLGHLCRCEWRDLREGEEWLPCLSLWGLDLNATLMPYQHC